MFYCEGCRIKMKWPEGFMHSYGTCEVCKATASCHDIPSSRLPDNPAAVEALNPRKTTIAERIEKLEQQRHDSDMQIAGLKDEVAALKARLKVVEHVLEDMHRGAPSA